MHISDLDIIFLSYDEPWADAFFERLSQISPRPPLRVHGVKGFDAAHKAAAELATTEHFVTVDADNIVRPTFFEGQIEPAEHVYSYTALNTVNGLAYGNGGVKIWPRDLVLTVDTHEKTGGSDFCWTYQYWQMNETASDVHFAQTQYHAFRAGYREAVKLSLVEGKKLADWPTTFERMYRPNLSRLLIWMSVGADVEHGMWAMYGARDGFADVWLDALDPDLINDYDWFASRWSKTPADSDIESVLGFEVPYLHPPQSRWFKTVWWNPDRHGLMIPVK